LKAALTKTCDLSSIHWTGKMLETFQRSALRVEEADSPQRLLV
jgi:hypothetical protein